MERIKVLVLSHMYPTNNRDTGIFIKKGPLFRISWQCGF